MKRSLFVVFCLATMVYAGAAYAFDTIADCRALICNVNNTYTLVGQGATGCNAGYTRTCYQCGNGNNPMVYDCDSCISGYTHSTETLSISTKTSVTVGQCKASGSGTGTYCTATNYYGSDYPEINGCSSIKAQKFGGKIVSTCTKCETGWTIGEQEESVAGCSNKYTYQTCFKNLIIEDCTPDNCQSDLGWRVAGNYSVKKTERTCVRNRCLEVTVYSCAGGYYGTATAELENCSMCPSTGGSKPIPGHSAAGNNEEITKCYAPNGRDATGSYGFDPKCYYTEQ